MKRQSLFSVLRRHTAVSITSNITHQVINTVSPPTLSFFNHPTNSESGFLIQNNSLPTAWELHREMCNHELPHRTSNARRSRELFTTNPTFSVNSNTRTISYSSIVQNSEHSSNGQKNGVPFYSLNTKNTHSSSTSAVARWKQFIYHLFQRKNNQRYTLLSAYLRQQRRGIFRTKKSFLPSGN